ncbi:MAG TPA: Asp23/Gls24 family envelope stress response protein [Anaerovoracaceae bacterium]|nr:Asp23/Gls24 family envelope stress response protein [Anaerovoracaceae bacterium]
MGADSEDRQGVVKISDEVIAICVLNSALKTEGVHGLSGGLTDSLSKNILGKDPLYKGIKVNQGDDGIVIDITVVVNYGVKIPDVAWNLQENVKKEIEEIIGMQVDAVNIHVTGVNFNET